MRRFHAKKIPNGEERVAERLLYSRCLGITAADRGGNVVDGLLSALDDKLLEVNVTSSAKAQGVAQLKAYKPRLDRPDKPNDQPDTTDNNKAKPKDR
jgi:hypothetical protein